MMVDKTCEKLPDQMAKNQIGSILVASDYAKKFASVSDHGGAVASHIKLM